jgi:hypothetical protein
MISACEAGWSFNNQFGYADLVHSASPLSALQHRFVAQFIRQVTMMQFKGSATLS